MADPARALDALRQSKQPKDIALTETLAGIGLNGLSAVLSNLSAELKAVKADISKVGSTLSALQKDGVRQLAQLNGATAKQVADQVASAGGRIIDALPSEADLSGIEQKLAEISGAVSNIRIPETDLSGLAADIRVIAKMVASIDIPVPEQRDVDLSAITTKLNEKKEFVFNIEYETSHPLSRIKRVKAKQVT